MHIDEMLAMAQVQEFERNAELAYLRAQAKEAAAASPKPAETQPRQPRWFARLMGRSQQA